MKKTSEHEISDAIIEVLSKDERVLVAFLYGSVVEGGEANDIDIAVYAAGEEDRNRLSADLKIALHKRTNFPPDAFDVRVLNGLAEEGDIFGLLYLKNVLSRNRLLVDRNPDARTDFIERYGTRYRECQGLVQAVLA